MTREPGDHAPVPAPPDAYVLERVRDALESDDRVGELGLGVGLRAGAVVVSGAVSNTARKAGVLAVAREVLAGLGLAIDVRDETSVPPTTGVDEEEVLG